MGFSENVETPRTPQDDFRGRKPWPQKSPAPALIRFRREGTCGASTGSWLKNSFGGSNAWWQRAKTRA